MDRAKTRWLSRENEPWMLTPGQTTVMESISRGNMPMIEVAADLGIHRNTVQTQIKKICAKTGARHWFDAYLKYRPQRDGPRRLGGRDRRKSVPTRW